MRVSFANNTLTVNTGIKATSLKKPAVYRDEKGNVLYYASLTNGGNRFNESCIECNTVDADGNACFVGICALDAVKEDIIAAAEEAIIAAHKYLELIAAEQADTAAILSAIVED